MATQGITIDRQRSTERIGRDVETLAGPDYTRSSESIMRYAYTPEYRKTLDYFIGELEALGFEHYEDPVGTLVARNRTAGEKVFGVGSHCEIGRASCRGKSVDLGGRRIIKKKKKAQKL